MLVLLKPHLWKSPDGGGREEEGAQRGSGRSGHLPRCIQPHRLHRKASSQPRTASFPPGTDSPSLLKVARAAGRSKTQRQQLSQRAGMAGRAGPGRRAVHRCRGRCLVPGGAAGFHSAPRCAFLFLDQVVLSTLLPDSVLTGREPASQGVTHL